MPPKFVSDRRIPSTSGVAALPGGRMFDGFSALFVPSDNDATLDPQQAVAIEVTTLPRLLFHNEWRFSVQAIIKLHNGRTVVETGPDIQLAVARLLLVIAEANVHEAPGKIEHKPRWKDQVGWPFQMDDEDKSVPVFSTWLHFLAYILRYLQIRSDEHGDDSWRHKRAFENGTEYCMNLACTERATKFMRLKRRYARFGEQLAERDWASDYRWFCEAHGSRGNWALSDSDSNYVIVTRDDVYGNED